MEEDVANTVIRETENTEEVNTVILDEIDEGAKKAREQYIDFFFHFFLIKTWIKM